jgi:hypothetical protein
MDWEEWRYEDVPDLPDPKEMETSTFQDLFVIVWYF